MVGSRLNSTRGPVFAYREGAIKQEGGGGSNFVPTKEGGGVDCAMLKVYRLGHNTF